ncbi:hypothetical protein [Psychroserpens sp.]|uniref:hypothetical protein n=1 Tax=Psychroserpens sp. TaxID=2020870 RepID=UPI00385F0316
MSRAHINNLKINQLILLLSFLPMLVHTIQHLFARSYFPFIFLILLVFVFAFLWSTKIIKAQSLLKLWGSFLLGYGLVRLALLALVLLTNTGIPSDIYYQMTIWYYITVAFTFSIGIWIIYNRKKLMLN